MRALLQPARHGVRVDERAVDLLGLGAQHAVRGAKPAKKPSHSSSNWSIGQLPDHPNLDQLKQQARELQQRVRDEIPFWRELVQKVRGLLGAKVLHRGVAVVEAGVGGEVEVRGGVGRPLVPLGVPLGRGIVGSSTFC